MLKGFSIGRIFGINIEINFSWIFIFFLVTFNLSAIIFPSLHPEWSSLLSLIVGVTASLLFFASVLAHELAHSLVARARGLPVNRITLFLFGGVSNLEREPPSPKVEFLMAGVGPLTSIILGIFFFALGNFIALNRIGIITDPSAFARLDPISTLLLWLGPVNIIVGLFNLIPGFPLDGGRLVRALLWGITGSLFTATRYASLLGRGFAWFFILIGIAMILGIRIPILGTGFGSGLWLVFIGWFLNSAASLSYLQLVVNRALEKVPVAKIMRKDIANVPYDVTINELIDNYIMQTDQHIFPVIKKSQLVGAVSSKIVKNLSEGELKDKKVEELMISYDKLEKINPDENTAKALDTLIRRGIQQAVVIDNRNAVGILYIKDIAKWLKLHSNEVEG